MDSGEMAAIFYQWVFPFLITLIMNKKGETVKDELYFVYVVFFIACIKQKILKKKEIKIKLCFLFLLSP